MIRFYKTATKILRTLKSYLTGAVLKIILFSYNLILRYVKKMLPKRRRSVERWDISAKFVNGRLILFKEIKKP